MKTMNAPITLTNGQKVRSRMAAAKPTRLVTAVHVACSFTIRSLEKVSDMSSTRLARAACPPNGARNTLIFGNTRLKGTTMTYINFANAYIECALWASMDEDGNPLDELYDLANQAVGRMDAD